MLVRATFFCGKMEALGFVFLEAIFLDQCTGKLILIQKPSQDRNFEVGVLPVAFLNACAMLFVCIVCYVFETCINNFSKEKYVNLVLDGLVKLEDIHFVVIVIL